MRNQKWLHNPLFLVTNVGSGCMTPTLSGSSEWGEHTTPVFSGFLYGKESTVLRMPARQLKFIFL